VSVPAQNITENPNSIQVQEALDEGRTLILGAQIMLGMLYRGVFEPGYDALPRPSQYLVVAALSLIVVAFAALVSPVAFHLIVDRGRDRRDFLVFVKNVMKLALPLLGASMALTLYVAAEKTFAPTALAWAATAGSSVALFAWHGGPGRRRTHQNEKANETLGQIALADRVKHVLTEARMVLPGAQALFGFQFITVLLSDYDRLPQSSKLVHLASLLLTSLSITLLMTPAAHHRIVEQGANTEGFYRFASRVLLVAMVPLALGIAGDFFVVVRKVTVSLPIAVSASVVVLVLSFGMWFGYTFLLRIKSDGHL